MIAAAKERVPRWEPAFPKGADPGFLAALVTQTPRAWVTPLLAGLNVAIFLAMTIARVDPWLPDARSLIKWGANYGPLTTAGQPWRLLASAFLHAGSPHLVINMVLLWQAGFLVERLVGNWAFLIAYLLAALCGSVASLAWNPYVISAGASAAALGVYGVLLGYLLRSGGPVPRKVIGRLARTAPVWIAVSLILGVLMPGIDLAAHLGGLAAGFGAGLVLSRPLGTRTSERAWLRCFVLSCVGLAAVAGVFALIPQAVDLPAEMSAFRQMQLATLNVYDTAVVEKRRGRLSDADFVKLVDEQVRPPWMKHLLLLRSLGRLRGADKEVVNTTASYIDLRERAWAKISQAIRTHDGAMMTEARVLGSEAAALAKSVHDKND
jgi:membrane associated rhomboid family serine protease